ncbi:MAG: AAA family ATPase [Oscillospiraceae bacterium]|jgi:ATP-dependent Clp protease ATP-binding subunit ClpC
MLCSRCHKRPASIFMTRLENGKTINEGYCLVCAKELGLKPVDDLIKRFGLSDEDLETLSNQMSLLAPEDGDGENGDFEEGGTPSFPLLFGLQKGGAQNQSQNDSQKKEQKPNPPKKRKFIDTYCENLTEKARQGKLDRIIGRDKEINRTLQILSRRQKNNPCLIGEAGVGKTAIAEGIAERIADGTAPAKMLDKEICLLDLTSLVAGTQFRGQFESRIKGLINEVKQSGNVILFIDEIHNLTGAGDSEGSMSAANILKPALSRGEIQVIGATTFNEYRKYIEKDQALERRFQPVTVDEPTIDETTEILRGIKKYYEDFHGVKVPDNLLPLISRYSERYIFDRFLPDKAIDLLDEACTSRAMRSPELAEYQSLTKKKSDMEAREEKLSEAENPDYQKLAEIKSEIINCDSRIEQLKPAVDDIELTEDDIASVIETWTGIPASKITDSEYKKVINLKDNLKKRIIGQDEAVELVADAIKRSRVGLQKRRRPASFIFVGPTGVGKTELAKVLSEELFDSVDPLIKIDMSEYMEKYAVSRLIGSPPGYIGYDEAGQLTEKVRRHPYSVILFDEIEKAHPDVLNILLQILDEGRITDAQGRTVNFEHTVICMTSNAGASNYQGVTGFAKTPNDMTKERMLNALSDFLRPEFLSRVDEIVVFNRLTDDDLKKIARLMLGEISDALSEKGVSLTYTDAVVDAILAKNDSGKYGARDLRKIIRKDVEDKIADILITDRDLSSTEIRLTAKNGEIKAEAVKADGTKG